LPETKLELVWFTAETVIRKEYESSKTFPSEWEYDLTEEQIKCIPQKKLRDKILDDIDEFNQLVRNAINIRMNWLLAEGFVVLDGDNYRFLCDQEIKKELENIENS